MPTTCPILDRDLDPLTHELVVMAKSHSNILYVEDHQRWPIHWTNRRLFFLRLMDGLTLIRQADLGLLNLVVRDPFVASTTPILIVTSFLGLATSLLARLCLNLIFAVLIAS